MKFSMRSALLGAALTLTGAIAGPALASGGDATTSERSAATGTEQPTHYVPLETTFRAFDSREISKLNGDEQGCCFDSSLTRFSPVGSDENGDRIVPPEAIGISYNVTVTATENNGFLNVRQANIGTSTTVLAWIGDNQRESSSGFVLFGPDTDGGTDAVEVEVGGVPGVKTHFTFEVTGYLLPIT